MSLVETRRGQIFPVLDMAQIETAKRFASGQARRFAAGEVVFDVGERPAPAWLVLEGTIEVVRRDGLEREAAITAHGAGQITGELSQLAGRASLAAGRPGGRSRVHRPAVRCRPSARPGGPGRDQPGSRRAAGRG